MEIKVIQVNASSKEGKERLTTLGQKFTTGWHSVSYEGHTANLSTVKSVKRNKLGRLVIGKDVNLERFISKVKKKSNKKKV